MKSTFIFIGHLLPRERCGNLNTWPPLKLEDGIECIIVKDGIAVYFFGDPADFDKLRDRVKELIDRLLDGYSLFTRGYLQVSWDNWIEAKDIVSNNNVLGWIDTSLKDIPSAFGHPDSQSFFRAYRLLPYMEQYLQLRVALRDWRIALSEKGDDYPFYCYRALESIRWHFQDDDSDEGRARAWTKMHESLGTSHQDFEQLSKDVSGIIRLGPRHKLLGTKQEYMALLRDTMYKIFRFHGISTDAFPDEVMQQIRDAFGSRPDLPPGEEYVRRIRSLWAEIPERG